LCCGAFTKSAAEKPAEVTGLKFPRGATLFVFAFFNVPAIFALVQTIASLVHGQKIELPFDMKGNRSPSLFIALHGFQGNAKEPCKIFLSFP
jgi:predicted alpha/beta-fold hydrolase